MNQKDESEVLDDLFGASDSENDNLSEQNKSQSVDNMHSDEELESSEEEEEVIEKKSKKSQKSKKGDTKDEPTELDGN